MPHFSNCCGVDEYICQVCAKAKCSKCNPSEWRTDITKNENAGNVCLGCIKKNELRTQLNVESSQEENPRERNLPSEKILSPKLKTWTKEAILGSFKKYNEKTFVRIIEAIYKFQTISEQRTETTHLYNNVGFNAYDATFASSLIKGAKQYGSLTGRQLKAAKRMMKKYCGQLALIKNGKQV